MNNNRIRAVALGLVLTATFATAACGDGNDSAGASTKKKPDSLADALFDESSFRERELEVQEAVRTCMEEQGFDYVPMDPSTLDIQRTSPGEMDSSEFRRTRGYGITTRPEESVDDSKRPENPNEKIRNSLSEEERTAYDRALYGDMATAGGGGGVVIRVGPGGPGGPGVEEPQDTGCFGKAQESVGGGPLEIGPQLEDLHQRIESDPRLVKANRAWAACMSKAGFSQFEKPEDIMGYLSKKLGDLTGDDGQGFGVRLDDAVDTPEMRALQQEELAIAAADDECSIETERRAIAKKVRAEAEKAFLEDNPDLGRS